MVLPGGDTALQNVDFERELGAFMASLRRMESGNNYNARGPITGHGHAHGAYQFLDKTWRPQGWSRDPNLAAKPYIGSDGKAYYSAADAPPHIQDERARDLMIRYYEGPAQGDWGAVAVAWHAGPDDIPAYFDGTLNKGDVNMSTVNYANAIVGAMPQMKGGDIKKYDYSAIDATDQEIAEGQAILDDWKTGFYGSMTDYESIDGADTEVQDAWQLAKDMLDDYGLSELFPEIESYLLKGLSAEAAIGRIRDHQVFKDRFKGLQGRLDNGYNAISPYQYLQQEKEIKNLMAEAGFPVGFYDDPDDLADFIANDVRPEEIASRIKLAQRAVMDADPLVKQELQERFGIGLDTEADLVAYFLDPERTVPLLEMGSQVSAAELGAATQRAMGTGLTLSTEHAQELARTGYTPREIKERLKGRGGMTQKMLGQTRGISATEVAAAEFGLDSEAVANIRRLRQERQLRGARRSGAMMTEAGVGGFGTANT